MLVAVLMVHERPMRRIRVFDKHFRHENMDFYIFSVKGHPQIAAPVVKGLQDFSSLCVPDLAQPVELIIRMAVDGVPFQPHSLGKSAFMRSAGVLPAYWAIERPQAIFPSLQPHSVIQDGPQPENSASLS